MYVPLQFQQNNESKSSSNVTSIREWSVRKFVSPKRFCWRKHPIQHLTQSDFTFEYSSRMLSFGHYIISVIYSKIVNAGNNGVMT
jgi:hypothetical protein